MLASRDASCSSGWRVEWDLEALLSLKSQLRVIRVGTVRGFPQLAAGPDREALVAVLHASFSCVPVFLAEGLHGVFYDVFCKQMLWPVFHNLMEIYGPVPTGPGADPVATRLFTGERAQSALFRMAQSGLSARDRSSSSNDPSPPPPPPPPPSPPLPEAHPSPADGAGGARRRTSGSPSSSSSSSSSSFLSSSSSSHRKRSGPGGGIAAGLAAAAAAGEGAEGGGGASGSESSESAAEAGGGPQPPAAKRRDPWAAYMAVQKEFKNKIMEAYHEGDLVWIHGFHLLLLPLQVSKAHKAAKIGLFLHTPFPSSEIFRTLGRREDLLRGMLSADQVGFHLFEYARHFVTCCRRLLGLEWTHDAGGVTIRYGGRSVLVTCIHAGMDQDVLRQELLTPQVQLEITQLMRRTVDKVVFAGIDRMERLKGVPLKLLAFERFLEQHPEHVGKVTLYQISLTARERGADYEATRLQVQALVERVRGNFGEDSVTYEEREEVWCQLKHRLALLSVADVFVTTTVRDGLNRWPLEYVLAQSYMQGAVDSASGSDDPLPKGHAPGLMILSEFTSCCRVLNGALHVNPWRVQEVADAMQQCVVMEEVERVKRLDMDVEFARVNTTASWCGRVLQDLKAVKKSADASRYVTLGFGTGRRVTAMKAGFDQIDREKVVRAYRKAGRRLLLLDFGGTIHDESTAHAVRGGGGGFAFEAFQRATGGVKRARPDAKVLAALKELCKDKRNRVFVLSGKSREEMVAALGSVPGLGLVAEAGFFFRRPEAASLKGTDRGVGDWEMLLADGDDNWKTLALAVMDVYMERTHGVYIQQNESAIVWKFQDADPEFAMIQSKEMEDQLKTLLKTLNAVVIRGDDYIEVRPAGISKGDFIARLLEEQYVEAPPEFALCIGDDPSDEKCYSVVKRFMRMATTAAAVGGLVPGGSFGKSRTVSAYGGGALSPGPQRDLTYYTATVGKKPTQADSYLNTVSDVVELLETMSKSRIENSKSMVNFEAPRGGMDGMPPPSKGGIGGAAGSPWPGGGGRSGQSAPHKGAHPPVTSIFGTLEGSAGPSQKPLNPIAETPPAPPGGASLFGTSPGALQVGSMPRSFSVPAMPTVRRPSSMMLNDYFAKISEDKKGGGGGAKGDGDEDGDGDGVWF